MSVIVWADIPVLDIERARAFYASVLQVDVPYMEGTENSIALIMGEPPSADLALNADTQPSTTHGTMIYLGSNGDIDGMVQRAVDAGGEVLAEKQFYGDMVGWIAMIKDTEGNRIGIQQPGA